MNSREKSLREELIKLGKNRARLEHDVEELEKEIDEIDILYNDKLMSLAKLIAQKDENTPAEATDTPLPAEILEIRGKGGDAVRLIYGQPDEIWTFEELYEHVPTFSSINSLNTSLSLLAKRGLLVKEPRVGFRAHPKIVRKMQR